MARTVLVIALHLQQWNGRDLSEGDAFDVSPVEALMLTYRKRARFASERDFLPQPDPEPPPPPTPPSKRRTRTPSTRKRTYRRKDMVAEE